jgi:hypothetical protein
MVAGLELNLARLTFDPAGAQPYLANFDDVGCRQLGARQDASAEGHRHHL